jgi:hypothetical protein
VLIKHLDSIFITGDVAGRCLLELR